MLKKILLLSLPLLYLAADARAQSSYNLRSSDGRIEIRIQTIDRIRYSVLFNGKSLLSDGTLSISINQATLGLNPQVKAAKRQSVDRVIEPAIRQKFAHVRENYNELRLEMEGGYTVVFRAYNEGVAYRFETTLPPQEVKVYCEEANFSFAGDYHLYYPKEDSFSSHNEREFAYLFLHDITPTTLASLPAVVDAGNGTKIAIGESDVDDYPGMWLHGTSSNGLSAVFPPYPLKEEFVDDNFKVSETADYIAVTRGTRTYPWRVLGIAEHDGDLLTNQLVYLLEKPSQVHDTSWIKPGKVAWDWWNANNIYGVDFKSGVNTETYKYYIDFAARYGIEYIIIDEGWSPLGNVLQVTPAIDMEELTAYARQKHVDIILWVFWKTLDDQLESALNQFEKWGIKGIKVDFMKRDDQKMINFYDRVCRDTAKRKMVVDFHGAIRSAIMTRTWPNLLTAEGVRGLEQSKSKNIVDPKHDVTIPFTRMFMGPMDYTPGAMINAAKGSFAPIRERPMSQGTRCHQLAMYVVYESPLQMLADSPSNYMREPETMEFLSAVPTVWDQTKVLSAKIGEYVVIARRHGNEWYVGAMTDWTARTLDIDLSFLGAGNFQMQSYQDGTNADRYGSDYKLVRNSVNRNIKLKLQLAAGGGWAARISPISSLGSR
jgi:alpha-glucosidase